MSANFLKGLASLTQMATAYPLTFETTHCQTEVPSEWLPGDAKLENSVRPPRWLNGQLLRLGPALWDVDLYKFKHMFDGMAMLYKFEFYDGEATYTNRPLESRAYQAAKKKGELAYREFATEPSQTLLEFLLSVFLRQFSDNNSINIYNVAGNYLAVGEVPVPVQFDPYLLATTGDFTFDDKYKGTTMPAHPHYDYENKLWINYFTEIGFKNSYNLFTIKDGSTKRELLGKIKVDRICYMHSFVITENYIILIEPPLVFGDPLNMILKYKQPIFNDFEWKPGRGTRFLVISKQDGTVVRTHQGPDFMGWHTINAYERGKDIFIDISSYADSSLTDFLYFDRLLKYYAAPIPQPLAYRYHLRPGISDVETTQLSDQHFDFPRINYETYNGKPYRYVYGAGSKLDAPVDWGNALMKVDVQGGDPAKIWDEPECYPGEPVFIPRPGAQVEDDGVVISLVLNGECNNSFMLVLDGRSFREIARAKLPHVTPFGFHGAFFPR
jgi:beta,beta-carotene 9',10'-dioxygenase